MKIPPLTAELSVGQPSGIYPAACPGAPYGAAASRSMVHPMATVSCLTGCVGSEAALRCANRCAGDLGCWSACAGISDTKCVAACLAS